MIQNETFNEYIEAYKKLPLQKKKQMANEEVKKLLAFIEKANNDLNLNDTILFNREILDLNSDNVSDDDFVEAIDRADREEPLILDMYEIEQIAEQLKAGGENE